MKKVSVTVPLTGEVIELDAETPVQIMEAYQQATQYYKAYELVLNKLKSLIPDIVDNKGLFEHDGYQFRVSYPQRKNYDKTALRQVFDDDLLDSFLVPKKTLIDTYLKDHLEEIGEASHMLRETMIEEGKPYRVIKLEKL